ncbi:hypothetical protein M885DRAFT_614913 [Pelagophyceae sp. CCMP2097]|nr:hypothetical protein M885DRAFT_614913 [Pelagophyceae sp. CCMP2097]
MGLPEPLRSLVIQEAAFFEAWHEGGKCVVVRGVESECTRVTLNTVLAALDAGSRFGAASADAAAMRSPRRSVERGADYQLGRFVGGGWEAYAGGDDTTTDATLTSEAARAALAAGYSLTVRHVELRDAAVAAACAALSEALGAPVQANACGRAYATPAGCCAMRPHTDRHDVYVLQLAGSKDWAVWEASEASLPTRERPPAALASPAGGGARVVRVVRLDAGDCLYVPRGVPHGAETVGTETSLHVSLGVDVHAPLTWAGAVHVALSRVAPLAITAHLWLHAAVQLAANVRAANTLRRACVPASRLTAPALSAAATAAAEIVRGLTPDDAALRASAQSLDWLGIDFVDGGLGSADDAADALRRVAAAPHSALEEALEETRRLSRSVVLDAAGLMRWCLDAGEGAPGGRRRPPALSTLAVD